jgi:hypothetical protein
MKPRTDDPKHKLDSELKNKIQRGSMTVTSGQIYLYFQLSTSDLLRTSVFQFQLRCFNFNFSISTSTLVHISTSTSVF